MGRTVLNGISLSSFSRCRSVACSLERTVASALALHHSSFRLGKAGARRGIRNTEEQLDGKGQKRFPCSSHWFGLSLLIPLSFFVPLLSVLRTSKASMIYSSSSGDIELTQTQTSQRGRQPSKLPPPTTRPSRTMAPQYVLSIDGRVLMQKCVSWLLRCSVVPSVGRSFAHLLRACVRSA